MKQHEVFVAWPGGAHTKERGLQPVKVGDSNFDFLGAANEYEAQCIARVTKVYKFKSDRNGNSLGRYVFDLFLYTRPWQLPQPAPYKYNQQPPVVLAAGYVEVPICLSIIQPLDMQQTREGVAEPTPPYVAPYRVKLHEQHDWYWHKGTVNTHPGEYTAKMLELLHVVYGKMKQEFFGDQPIQ